MSVETQSPADRIQVIFLSILSEIQKRPTGNPKITLKRIVPDHLNLSQQVSEREVTYRWPGKNREEAWRFACVGKILTDIHDALQKGLMITKRDIYYRDPELYGRQRLVDRYVDDIAFTFNVTRRDLNVTASAKGLYAGLRVRSSGDEAPNRAFDVVPDGVFPLEEHCLDHLNWILVIEKEVGIGLCHGVLASLTFRQATFRSLVDKAFHIISINGPGIIVTAKGYPDLSTRRFVRALCDHSSWRTRPRPPIFGLFDADPDGMNIMQVHRQGSRSLPHESAFNVPEMQWLGVRTDEVLNGLRDDEAVLQLTSRDRSKAVTMLERLCMQSSVGIDEECKVELQRMLILNVKAEIQLLEDRPGGLAGWLDDRIRRQSRRS